MKNKEKYYDEILEIVIKSDILAINKTTNKPMRCKCVANCENCLFRSNCNATSRQKWLEEEYKEPIHLTDDEIVILKSVNKNYQWIARDESTSLYTFTDKPCKDKIVKTWVYDKGYCTCLNAFSHLFQFIKWSDEEPYSIDELLKQNGVER